MRISFKHPFTSRKRPDPTAYCAKPDSFPPNGFLSVLPIPKCFERPEICRTSMAIPADYAVWTLHEPLSSFLEPTPRLKALFGYKFTRHSDQASPNYSLLKADSTSNQPLPALQMKELPASQERPTPVAKPFAE